MSEYHPVNAKWFEVSREVWCPAQGFYDDISVESGAVTRRQAARLVETINGRDPRIKAHADTGPNYGGFYQVVIGDAERFKKRFREVSPLKL